MINQLKEGWGFQSRVGLGQLGANGLRRGAPGDAAPGDAFGRVKCFVQIRPKLRAGGLEGGERQLVEPGALLFCLAHQPAD